MGFRKRGAFSVGWGSDWGGRTGSGSVYLAAAVGSGAGGELWDQRNRGQRNRGQA